jgi:hypothetical protein
MAMESGLKRFFKRLDRLPFVVNGDDGLLPANRSSYEKWTLIAQFVGLKPSVGKVYFDRSYFNINSTCFTLSPQDDSIITHGYINWGLYYGQKRSSLEVSDNSGEDLSLITFRNSVIGLQQYLSPNLFKKVYVILLKRNFKLLKNYNIPWFIPISYGGLGLPVLYEDQVDSDFDVDTYKIKYFQHGNLRIGPSDVDLKYLKICNFNDHNRRIDSSIRSFKPVQSFDIRGFWSHEILSKLSIRKLKLYGSIPKELIRAKERFASFLSKLDTLSIWVFGASVIDRSLDGKSRELANSTMQLKMLRGNEKAFKRIFRVIKEDYHWLDGWDHYIDPVTVPVVSV